MDTPTVVFGLVVRDLDAYRRFIHVVARSPLVSSTDFTYAAPIYKGSDAIKQALQTADGALDKFDAYYQHALADEAERIRYGRMFKAAYLKRFPASERQDVFLASGDVLKVTFELVPPSGLQDSFAAVQAIERTPHDTQVLAQLKRGEPFDRAHLRADVKVFFDHVMNPRRREVPQVQAAMAELGIEEAFVVELVTSGALPGYIFYVVHPFVHQIGGRLVLLPG